VIRSVLTCADHRRGAEDTRVEGLADLLWRALHRVAMVEGVAQVLGPVVVTGGMGAGAVPKGRERLTELAWERGRPRQRAGAYVGLTEAENSDLLEAGCLFGPRPAPPWRGPLLSRPRWGTFAQVCRVAGVLGRGSRGVVPRGNG
jgi:hypothetical protein